MARRDIAITLYASPDLIPANLKRVAMVLDDGFSVPYRGAPEWSTILYWPGQTVPSNVKQMGGVLYSAGDAIPPDMLLATGWSPFSPAEQQINDSFLGTAIGALWTVTDLDSGFSVANGTLSCSGGGGWGRQQIQRQLVLSSRAGWTFLASLTPTNTTDHKIVGFSTTTLLSNAAASINALYFSNDGFMYIPGTTAIKLPYAYTAGSTYLSKIVLAATGAFLYISADAGVTWDLIWKNVTGTDTTLHAGLAAAGAFSSDYVRAYYGSVKPPVISTTPAAPTLTLGAELLTNGNMETGSPPSSWSGVSATLTAQADERTGGSGSQSLDIARNGVDTAYARQTLAVSAGAWVIVSAWRRKVNGQVADINLRDDTSVFFNSVDYTSTTWAQLVAAARVTGTNAHIRLIAYSTLADGTSSRFDDVSVKPLPFDTTGSLVYLGEHGQHNGIYSVNPTITALYQAGVVVHANSVIAPTYCLHGYMDRTLAKAYLVKIVAGVTTELTSGSITYSAGAALEIISNETQHGLYYNKALVGSMQTLDVSSNYGLSMFGFQTLATDSLGLSEAHV